MTDHARFCEQEQLQTFKNLCEKNFTLVLWSKFQE